MSLLSVKGLSVSVGGSLILDRLNFEVSSGEIVLIAGSNGSGKSTFLKALFKFPEYNISFDSYSLLDNKGNIISDLKDASLFEIVSSGLFLSFQEPPNFEGVRFFDFLFMSYKKICNSEITKEKFEHFVKGLINSVGLSEKFLDRDLNVGFSGGEKKKVELLQILLFSPKFIFLDEIDSGVDIDSQRIFASVLRETSKKGSALIIVSHNKSFQNLFRFNKVYSLKEKKLILKESV